MSTPLSATAGEHLSRHDLHVVEQFLYTEAELLDQWRLDEWLALFGPDGTYEVPAPDLPDGDPATDLLLIQDDRFLLEQRVSSLLTNAAHAEFPRSRTRRLITNVRATATDVDHIRVTANFAVHRARNGSIDLYVGQYQHILRIDSGDFAFVKRRAILDLDVLRPHGKISIIL
jgi:p-cumate 2,3-dioxygenase beta subunit